MNSFIKKIFILIFLLVTTAFGTSNIKITIIERITQFIQWPKLEDKFVIGIYQNEQLKDKMKIVLKDKKIQKLPIEVFNIKNHQDKRLSRINLLYFTKESSSNVDKIFKKIKGKPVLIITDFPDDVYNGMHLGLYYQNRKIKFVINQESLENAKLKASYKILKLSKIVKEAK